MGGAGQKRYYPAFVDLEGRLAVIVGPGEAAESKAERLVSYGADIVIITEDPTERLTELEGEGSLTIEDRPYAEGDLAGAFLVVCLAEDPEQRDRVVSEANANGALLSVKGAGSLGNHITPSVVRRGALQIAISTAGVAPTLAHRIKAHVSATYGPEWGPYLDLLAEVRVELGDRSSGERKAIMAAIVDSDVLDRIVAGEMPEASELVAEFEVAAEPGEELGPEAAAASADEVATSSPADKSAQEATDSARTDEGVPADE
ncbi:MAG: bifunctional precorrin-2 dehydrogenase/sirohydrochlorin ferrochelatase [Coriobacteriales bacterium]|nr:bifunctional precorrin-2 dehydrogenase/sirohydrochlorin ferrochelatase [Coriobacteriales bacterium]